MEEMIIISTMLDKAKVHGLELECVVALVNEMSVQGFTLRNLSDACEHALCVWDI